MEHFNQNISSPGSQFPKIYSAMVERFPSGSTFVEVGTYVGKSLAYLVVEVINSRKNIRVIGIDSFTFGDMFSVFIFNMKPVEGYYEYIIGDSADSASKFEDNSVDFVFLDADHVYENIKKDILAWLPKIKRGGVIAGHDYVDLHPGVIQAVNEIFGEDKIDKTYVEEWSWLVNL